MMVESKGAKPRIAFVSTMNGSGWGGSEELWGRTALRLVQENRADVSACVNWFPGTIRQLDELEAAGVRVERRKTHRLRHVLLNKVFPRPPFLERVRPDLVIISQGAHFDGAAWMLECANRKLRYAPIAHCFVEGHSFADTHAEPLRRGYEESVRNYFVSEANLRDTRRQIAAPITQAKVIRNPCNVSFEANPPWPEPKDGIFRLASVARLETVVKGHDILLDTLRAPKWKERPLHVTLYGSGPNEQTLKCLKKMYGLDNVTFAGTTSNVENIWRDHHALILTSRWEGLPLSVVEAMLCGRIAIVTDVGGNAELLTDNETGFVAAASKTALVDEALERAWQCRENWKVMGEQAARQVRGQIPPDPIRVFMDEILSLLA
ncbi:MAG: glycosyltransferase family 4 protein [Fibrella sp.]|nr:glycosyltransferase family 4 protein [Armatimonadota bacterium]